jgi:predicted transcriptional regulator
MILLENSILQLEYSPATDILRVRYPDLQRYHLSEIKHSLQVMVETIRNYDVRRLLLDASTTSVEIDDAQNRQLTLELASMLAKTRLLKVARVRPFVDEDETRAQQNIEAARKAGLFTYEVGTFTSQADAIAWLQA